MIRPNRIRVPSLILVATCSLWLEVAHAIPLCTDFRGSAIAVDDAEVMGWKRTTPNQTLERAHVSGPVTAVFADRNGHNHFQIQIGPLASDALEVVYSQSFGPLGPVRVGMNAEACGDYITSDAATAQYPASPDGAIIHWVHDNPSGHGHPGGFLVLDGVLYGQK